MGEVSEIKTGKSDVKDSVREGLYPFFIRSEKVERSNRYLYDGEAILMPGEGRLGEIFHYINGKFDFHQRVYKISDFKSGLVDGKYIFYHLQTNFKRHALKYTAKATVDSLRLPMLTEYVLAIPGLEEQSKIYRLLDDMNRTIALHHHKLLAVRTVRLRHNLSNGLKISPILTE